MNLLKRENWWIWLLLFLFTGGASGLILGALLGVFDKNAWYAKWQYWLIGVLCFFLPAVIMFWVFYLTILTQTAAKLEVPGKELYLSPYVWILCIIIPILGWLMISVMMLYISIWILVMLYRGYGEKY